MDPLRYYLVTPPRYCQGTCCTACNLHSQPSALTLPHHCPLWRPSYILHCPGTIPPPPELCTSNCAACWRLLPNLHSLPITLSPRLHCPPKLTVLSAKPPSQTALPTRTHPTASVCTKTDHTSLTLISDLVFLPCRSVRHVPVSKPRRLRPDVLHHVYVSVPSRVLRNQL